MKLQIYISPQEGDFLTVKDKICKVVKVDSIIVDGDASYIKPQINNSKRASRYKALMDELEHWGLGYDNEALKVIASELSWRMVVRIVHRLKRKRGAE